LIRAWLISPPDRSKLPEHSAEKQMRFLVLAVMLLLSIGSFTSANAAEVRCESGHRFVLPKDEADAAYAKRWPSGVRPTSNTCSSGLISGPIEPGDYEKVRALYRQNHPFLGGFTLASPGRNVLEALKIGKLFRRYLIIAFAPVRITSADGRERFAMPGVPECDNGRCLCASACALIWFGAIEHWGSAGLHRPHTDDPSFKALDPPAAAESYRRMLDAVRQYLDEMEVPRAMIEAMVATGSADLRWVTIADDLSRPPSLAEWEDATCGTFSAKERELLSRLSEKGANPTKEAQGVRDKLQDKQLKRRRCVAELLASRRDKLPPP
jgi:hypothetical protein